MIPIDSRLLKELKRGDHMAFKRIFERYGSQLFQFSLSYLKSKEAAEDIVQEVFAKIWNNRKEIKTDKSFQAYLFTIALNAVRKYFNKLSRLQKIKHDVLFDFSTMKPDFDDVSNYQLLLDRLDELIQEMPERRRTVFVKKKIEGKSMKEISQELNITTKTVEYHVAEAMKFLREEFEKLHVQGLIFLNLFVG